MNEFGSFWRSYSNNLGAVSGLAVLLLLVVMMATAGMLYPGSPFAMAAQPLLAPGTESAFPLGTDALGRDVAAGIFHGSRITFLIAFVATFMAITIGTTVGAISGYYGGWIDDLLVRVIEIFQTIPQFMFLVVLVGIFQPTITTIVFAIGIVSWPAVARLVRAEFLAVREREFVQAALVIGMSDTRIVLTQLLPNALAPIVVMSSVIISQAILNESALSFLGLGDPDVMTWGSMIGGGRDVLRVAPSLTFIPGIAILISVLAFNLIGDGLNDALNPRRRNR
jgi:peptide/nickel transport system permease protein